MIFSVGSIGALDLPRLLVFSLFCDKTLPRSFGAFSVFLEMPEFGSLSLSLASASGPSTTLAVRCCIIGSHGSCVLGTYFSFSLAAFLGRGTLEVNSPEHERSRAPDGSHWIGTSVDWKVPVCNGLAWVLMCSLFESHLYLAPMCEMYHKAQLVAVLDHQSVVGI